MEQWTREGMIFLSPPRGGFDSARASHPWVLQDGGGGRAVSSACVLDIARTFHMFYASQDGDRGSIALATSKDGVSWDRRGTTLAPPAEEPEGHSLDTPCVVRLRDGSLHMWYAALAAGDTGLAYRIHSARFSGSSPT
jgi:hypothetical protein